MPVAKELKIEDKLNELIKEFDATMTSQHQNLADLAKQACDNYCKLHKSVDGLQESLDYLRICIKYQVFDLEATRRENKQLRDMLEKKQDNS
jgi:hypothetical protein